MLISKKWYAVYTRPRWEKRVAELLDRENIITYCPLTRVLRQWSDRKKIVHEPLFRCYVFVWISKEEMIRVKETAGVVKFVYWLNEPAVIKDVEIEIIKEFLQEYWHVQVEQMDLNIRDVVRIVDGPLRFCQGNVISISKSKVKVALPSLGYMVVAEVDASDVEIIKKAGFQNANSKRMLNPSGR